MASDHDPGANGYAALCAAENAITDPDAPCPWVEPADEERLRASDPELAARLDAEPPCAPPCSREEPCWACRPRRRFLALLLHREKHGKPVHPSEAAGSNGEAPPPPRRVATIDDLVRAGSAVQWLWPGWIQRGVLTALAAEAGLGKTRFCADLLRRIRHGLPWPDGTPMNLPPDTISLWVLADNHHDEIVDLVRDFDIADVVRVNAWAEEPYGGTSLDEAEDLALLDARIGLVMPTIVIVDTVGNATDRNLSRQEDAKAFYFPLQVLARKHRIALMTLTHLNASGKFLGRRVLEKVRVAIRMEKPDEHDPRRRLEVPKTNSKSPAALGVTMGDGGNEYDPDPPAAPVDEPGAAAGQGGPKVQEAMDWLTAYLAGGAKRVSEARTAAEAAGFTAPRLYDAVRRLGVEENVVQGRKWWSLKVVEAEVPW